MTGSPWRPAVPPGMAFEPADAERSVGDAFRDAASRFAECIAVSDGSRSLTYTQLDGASDAVAAALAGALQTGLVTGSPTAPGGSLPVIVLTGHDAHAVIAMLGVAKAGHLHMVLDPRAPSDFLASIVDRHGACAIVTDLAHRERAALLVPTAPHLVIEELPAAVPPAIVVDPAQALSVSSTSGTSGRPKAVVHSHRNVVHNAMRFGAATEAGPADRFLVTLPFPFVASGTPTFAALLAGATAVVHDLGGAAAKGFMDIVRESEATVVFLTAGLISSLTGHEAAPVAAVRLVVTGGDRLTTAHVRVVHARFPRATLLHRYNTSETHWAAGLVIDPMALPERGSVPIGWPVPWLEIDVVGGADEGEAVVRGDFLALGYLDDPGLTDERFATSGAGRAYRTLDLVRRGQDGMLDFLGRADAMVKVRDVLVDPARVEAAIEAGPGVAAAAVVAWTAADGVTRLAAYVVAPGVRSRDIRRGLAAAVPMSMVPATIVMVAELPLTAMGKVDAGRLTTAAERSIRAEFARARGPVEQAVIRRFESILVVQDVGRDDDFFALGADSLATAELLAALDQEFGVAVEMSALLEHPTPRELAALIRNRPRPRGRGDSHLIKVTTGSSGRAPVVMFSGGSGALVEGMANLARHLDDRTCHVVIPRAFEYRGRPDRTIAAMARSAAADVKALRPVGPVVLLGHSSGGNVAFEAARQLRAAGIDIALVVLLDSAASTPLMREGRRLRPTARRTIAGGVDYRRAAGKGTSAARKAFWGLRLVAQRVEQRGRALLAGVAAGPGPARDRAFRALVSLALVRAGQPSYDGDVLLVRAADIDPGHAWAASRDLRWGEYVRGECRVVEAPGRHEQLVDPPFDTSTAAVIESAIESATGAAARRPPR